MTGASTQTRLLSPTSNPPFEPANRNFNAYRPPKQSSATESKVYVPTAPGGRGTVEMGINLWLTGSVTSSQKDKNLANKMIRESERIWRTDILSTWEVQPTSLPRDGGAADFGMAGQWFDVDLLINQQFAPPASKAPGTPAGRWHNVEAFVEGGTAWDLKMTAWNDSKGCHKHPKAVARDTGEYLEGTWKKGLEQKDVTHEMVHALGLEDFYEPGDPRRGHKDVLADIDTGSYSRGDKSSSPWTIDTARDFLQDKVNQMQLELILGYQKPGGIPKWKAREKKVR